MRSRGNSLRLLIYEHASAGGYADGSVSPGILAEGFGMFRSMVSGLKLAGHHVTVLLAAELSRFNPPINADCILPVLSFKEAQDAIRKTRGKIDAVYILAPESGGTLQSFVKLVEQSGVASLNCQSTAIGMAADKAFLYENLKVKGLPTPDTSTFNFSDHLADIKSAIKSKFCFPVLFKPLDGVGCSGLSIVETEAHIADAMAKVKSQSESKGFLVQEFVSGEAASISLLTTGKDTLPVSLNKQEISLVTPNKDSSYDGGCVPYEHPFWLEASQIAQQVVGCFSGLRGYVGVDLVLSADGPMVVDVNPRLTTSFVGLSNITGFNISEALLNAALKSELPAAAFFQGVACFIKLKTPNPSSTALQELNKLGEVVSPPFPVQGYSNACAMILGKGYTLKDAAGRLEEAKKHTLNIINRGN